MTLASQRQTSSATSRTFLCIANDHASKMICHRCLLRASRSSVKQLSPSRTLSRSARHLEKSITADAVAAKPRTGSPDSEGAPAATSTSAAQPFSTPITPSPEKAGVKSKANKDAAILVQSAVPAGTELRGLNFLKNGSDPIALKDEEYPPWLWTILEPKKKASAIEEETKSELFDPAKSQRAC